MNVKLTATVLGAALAGIAAGAGATPVQVDYADIIAATSEDFESFSGDQGSSQTFDGFTATVSTGNLSVSRSSTFCETSGDKCLINQNATKDTRTFDSFATGTNYFGFDLTPIADGGPSPTTNLDVFKVVVSDNSGSTTFNVKGNGLFGFGDAAGLTSVAITNLGDGGTGGSWSNYGLDDVITGTNLQGGTPTAPVPLPASALLLATALGALRLARGHQRG